MIRVHLDYFDNNRDEREYEILFIGPNLGIPNLTARLDTSLIRRKPGPALTHLQHTYRRSC